MVVCLEYICGLGDEELSREKKFEFFSETRHAFGRTALIFSGGANMGLYHYGVAKCLFEEGLFPRIIAGSSIGSIFASFICTKRMDELPDFLNPDRINLQAFYKRDSKKSFIRKLMRLFSEGHFLDNEVIKEFMRDNIGDVTFQEAYDRTGWILNITATGYGEHDGYRLLNYLTAPNVLIWSAVCASCAIPYIYGPAILYCKNEEGQIEPYIPGNRKFVDGSIGADLPMQNLSELFNVNYFIVSQTNPWVVPFMNHSESYRHSKRAIIFRAWEFIKDFIGSEIKHRINQLEKLGILSSAIARYVNLITQQYGGHVTIWPHPTLNDFIHLLDNPTHEMLRRCLIKGATRVYHKVNHIASVLVVERALERNYVKAKILHERPAVRLYKGVGEANHEESTESNENDTHPDTLFDDVDYMPRNSIGYERKTQAHHPDIHVHSGEHLQNERLTSLGLFKYVEEQ
jgi:Predicted esterase of the alpha-beta hydrolase superfamily